MARIANFSFGPITKPRVRAQSKHRVIDNAHLAFVRTLPCVATAACNMIAHGCIAHHLTLDRYRMGRKAGDDKTLPLLPRMHDGFPASLHVVGERNFWNALGVDAVTLARELYEHTSDYAACVALIATEVRAADARRRSQTILF